MKTETKPNDAAGSNASDAHGNPTVGYGLTKREHFAAIALQGLISASCGGRLNKEDAEYFAQNSVIIAEALITELNKSLGVL